MIGFNYLGKMGQLGNQMFQYASLKGIARKRGYEFCIPNHDEVMVDVLGNRLRIELFDAFDLREEGKFRIGFMKTDQIVQEPTFEFCRELLEECPDDVCIVGYLQTEKYFKHIEDEIREDFSFNDDILEPCNEFISNFENILFLHVRRGDNVGREEYYRMMTFDYYERALKHFDDDAYVLIMTDDPEWCSKQEFFDDDRFLLNTDVPRYEHECLEGDGTHKHSFVPYTDLCLMSLCNGAILSSSTLGWWGAWLQKGRTNSVVVPEHWYGPTLEKVNDCRDLYPEDWTVLPN